MQKLILAFACLLFTTGCSELSSRVSGQVSLDGQKVSIGESERGTVQFRPIDGGPNATAIIGSDGTYSLNTGTSDGVKPGEYMVSVRLVEMVPAAEEGGAPSGRPLTPAIYANPLESGLQCTVKAGDNNFDIELDSSAGPIREMKIVADEEEQVDAADSGVEVESDLAEQSTESPSEESDTTSESSPNNSATSGDESSTEGDGEQSGAEQSEAGEEDKSSGPDVGQPSIDLDKSKVES